MKTLLLTLLILGAVQTSTAQSSLTLTEGTPALVYALPKTALSFELTVEKVLEKPGAFYLYSQRYLATDKVILEEQTTYTVNDVKVTSQAVPDPSRRFSILQTDKSVLKHLVVDEQGILCGVNVPTEKKAVDTQKEFSRWAYPTQSTAGDILPLTQEYMMAGSTAKLAEGAAKQIYDIRASRISLLTGEMDHLPADGQSLKLMLSGLDRQEKILTELFVGSKTSEITTHYITITPDAAKRDEVFFRFSAKRGLVDKDDMGGAPYFITIAPENIQQQPANSKGKPAQIGLYTVLPAQTAVKVTDGTNTLIEKNFFVPQFGVLVPLPESLFNSPKVSVKVDPATGRLLSIDNQ